MDGTEEVTVAGYEFTYYPWSGGLVVTRQGYVVDAGIIGAPGNISGIELARVARHWLMFRKDWEVEVERVGERLARRRFELWKENRGVGESSGGPYSPGAG